MLLLPPPPREPRFAVLLDGHCDAFVAQALREHLCDVGIVFDHLDQSLVLRRLPLALSIRDAQSGRAHVAPRSHGVLLIA